MVFARLRHQKHPDFGCCRHRRRFEERRLRAAAVTYTGYACRRRVSVVVKRKGIRPPASSGGSRLHTVARYSLARLVAARHAIWRMRRTGSQPCDNQTDTDSYVSNKSKKINQFFARFLLFSYSFLADESLIISI